MKWLGKYKLSVKITEGSQTKILLGQIKEFEGVTAQGWTEEELLNNLDEAMDAYFDAFPEELEKLK